VALAAALACRGGPARPPLPAVALHVTAGDAAARVLASAAEQRGLARVALVGAPAEADLLWLADPTEVIEAGDLVAEGAAPDPADVDPRHRDPRRRFAPLCARARVLLLAPGRALPFAPDNLRDLADPRLAGRVALAPPSDGAGPAALAALAVVYGEASLQRFLDLLAANRPQLAASEAEVRARVVRGEADVGLAGSEEGAAGAASAAGLEVVYPDQAGRGAVVLPAAIALTRRGATSAAARALAGFLAGAEAERLLAARAPGFLPLRPEVPVPVGVRPAGNVASLSVDWDELARAKRRLLPTLRAWSARAPTTAAPAPRPGP
jgi:iron(III) transport system substrate-binding protein